MKGQNFEEEKFVEAENDLRRTLTDSGYAFATVIRDATVDLVTLTADVRLTVQPGKLSRFGKSTITGLLESAPLPAPVKRIYMGVNLESSSLMLPTTRLPKSSISWRADCRSRCKPMHSL